MAEEITLCENNLMLTVNDGRFDYSSKLFLKRGLGKPIRIDGVVNTSHERACFLGHLKMLEYAKSHSLPYYVAFEDDAYPCDDCKDKLKTAIDGLSSENINWDMLILGICGEHTDERHVFGKSDMQYENFRKTENVEFITNECMRIYRYVHGAHAYVVKKSAYEGLFKSILKFDTAVDYMLSYASMIGFGVTSIATKNMLFCQHEIKDGKDRWWYPYFYNIENLQIGPLHDKDNTVIPSGFSL